MSVGHEAAASIKATQREIYRLFPILAERRLQLAGSALGGRATDAGAWPRIDE